MTNSEREAYNKLSAEAKKEYNHIKMMHPNWSHNQIMTKLAINGTIDNMVEDGKDVNPDDPNILAQILQGAKDFLKNAGIYIADVFQSIDNALTYLGELIKDGIDYVGGKIDKLLGWILG